MQEINQLEKTKTLDILPLEFGTPILSSLSLKNVFHYSIASKGAQNQAEIALSHAGFRSSDPKKEVAETANVFQQMLPFLQKAKLCSSQEDSWKNVSLTEVKNILDYLRAESRKQNPSPLYRILRAIYFVALPSLTPKARMPKWFVQDPVFREVARSFDTDNTIANNFGIDDHISKTVDTTTSKTLLSEEQLATIRNKIQLQQSYYPETFFHWSYVIGRSTCLTTPKYCNIDLSSNKEHILTIVSLAKFLESPFILHIVNEFDNIIIEDVDFIWQTLECYNNPYILRYASNKLKNNPEFILQTLKRCKNFNVLSYASNELQNNPEFIRKIDDLRNNLDFMLEVLELSKDPKVIELASDELKNNPIFMGKAVEYFRAYEVFHYASDELKNNSEFILKALKYYENHNVLLHASNELKNNPEFIFQALEWCERRVIFLYIDPSLKNNPEFMLKIYKYYDNDPRILFYASDELKTNSEFMLQVLQCSKDPSILKYASDKLKNSKTFLKSAINITPGALRYYKGYFREFTLDALAAYVTIKQKVETTVDSLTDFGDVISDAFVLD